MIASCTDGSVSPQNNKTCVNSVVETCNNYLCGSCGGGVDSAVAESVGFPCVMPVESDERDEQGGIHGGDELTAEVEEDVERVDESVSASDINSSSTWP